MRTSEKALEVAQDYYQQAAGVLRYMSECFVQSSTADTQPQVLKTLMNLMLVSFSLLLVFLCVYMYQYMH